MFNVLNYIFLFSTSTLLLKSDLVKSLTSEDHQIFSYSNDMYNPYAPGPNALNQFNLPLTIKDDATDEHGQIEAEFLDQIFDYISVGSDSDGEELIDTGDTT